jgi:hypothetical protein
MIEAFCSNKDCPIGDQKAVNYCWKKNCPHLRFCVRRAPRKHHSPVSFVTRALGSMIVIFVLAHGPYTQAVINLLQKMNLDSA